MDNNTKNKPEVRNTQYRTFKVSAYSKHTAFAKYLMHIPKIVKDDQKDLIALLRGIRKSIDLNELNSIATHVMIRRFRELLNCTIDIYELMNEYKVECVYPIDLEAVDRTIRQLDYPKLVRNILMDEVYAAKRRVVKYAMDVVIIDNKTDNK